MADASVMVRGSGISNDGFSGGGGGETRSFAKNTIITIIVCAECTVYILFIRCQRH